MQKAQTDSNRRKSKSQDNLLAGRTGPGLYLRHTKGCATIRLEARRVHPLIPIPPNGAGVRAIEPLRSQYPLPSPGIAPDHAFLGRDCNLTFWCVGTCPALGISFGDSSRDEGPLRPVACPEIVTRWKKKRKEY